MSNIYSSRVGNDTLQTFQFSTDMISSDFFLNYTFGALVTKLNNDTNRIPIIRTIHDAGATYDAEYQIWFDPSTSKIVYERYSGATLYYSFSTSALDLTFWDTTAGTPVYHLPIAINVRHTRVSTNPRQFSITLRVYAYFELLTAITVLFDASAPALDNVEIDDDYNVLVTNPVFSALTDGTSGTDTTMQLPFFLTGDLDVADLASLSAAWYSNATSAGTGLTGALYYTTGTTLETGEWRTDGTGVVAQDTSAYIRFTASGTKQECWNDTSINAGPLVIGERYRVEITIGDVTAGTVTALVKDTLNSDQASQLLSANTLGINQSFIFTATDTFMQQNLRTGNSAGYMQCGELKVYGPLDLAVVNPDIPCYQGGSLSESSLCPEGEVGTGLLVQVAKNEDWQSTGYFSPWVLNYPPEWVYGQWDTWYNTGTPGLDSRRWNPITETWASVRSNPQIDLWLKPDDPSYYADLFPGLGVVHLFVQREKPIPTDYANYALWPTLAGGPGLPFEFGEGDQWHDLNNGNARHKWSASAQEWVLQTDVPVTGTGTGTASSNTIHSYFQTTAPVATGLPGGEIKVGNQWFDTNADLNQYWFDGNDWIDVEDSNINFVLAGGDNPAVITRGESYTFFSNVDPWYDPAYIGGDPYALSSYRFLVLGTVINFQAAIDDGYIEAPRVPIPGVGVGDILVIDKGGDQNLIYNWDGWAWIEGHYVSGFITTPGRDCTPVSTGGDTGPIVTDVYQEPAAPTNDPVVDYEPTLYTFYSTTHPWYDSAYVGGDPYVLSSYSFLVISPGPSSFQEAIDDGYIEAPIVPLVGVNTGDILIVASTTYTWDGYAWRL